MEGRGLQKLGGHQEKGKGWATIAGNQGLKGFGERRRELGGMREAQPGAGGRCSEEGVPGLLGGCWRRREYGATRGTQGGGEEGRGWRRESQGLGLVGGGPGA